MTVQLSTQTKPYPQNFVEPTLSDFDKGAVLARQGRMASACANDEQRAGWDWFGELCYLRCLEAERQASAWAYVPAVEDDYADVRRGN